MAEDIRPLLFDGGEVTRTSGTKTSRALRSTRSLARRSRWHGCCASDLRGRARRMCSITSDIPSAPTDSMSGSVASLALLLDLRVHHLSHLLEVSLEEAEGDDLVRILRVPDDEDLGALGHFLGAVLATKPRHSS